MTDIKLFNAARAAGMPPKRATRYVHYVRMCEARGRTPLTPQEAAAALLLTQGGHQLRSSG